MGFFSQKPKLPTPVEFYTTCCKEFHDLADEYGITPHGVIFVPELVRIGEDTVLEFLKDPFFQMEFSDNPQQYYFVINTMCFMAGVVFADKWHHQVSALKSGFVQEVIKVGPPDYAAPILEEVIGLEPEHCNALYSKIYTRWLQLHDPYWKLRDPRDYTFKLMLASYQLGVSATLSAYGFK